jgi:hypothetical protein
LTCTGNVGRYNNFGSEYGDGERGSGGPGVVWTSVRTNDKRVLLLVR